MRVVKRLCTRLARWLLTWANPPAGPPVDPVEAAVRGACGLVGLPLDALRADFDVYSTGKLPEVLYHAARALDPDHSIRTVADLVGVFRGAR